MKENTKHHKELQQIPGVGPSIAKDLLQIGIKRVEDLKGKNPATLYEMSNQKRELSKTRACWTSFDVPSI